MPMNLSSVAEAMTAFMRIISLVKESLRKILLRGEFDEYPDEMKMHSTARLAEMLNQYSDDLQKFAETDPKNKQFLMEEIKLLEEAKGIALPNFISRTPFLAILQRKVKGISGMPVNFVTKVWDYLETVVISVLFKHYDNYPQLQSSTRRATHNLIAKMKKDYVDRVMEIMEMKRLSDYTCNLEYMSSWHHLMSQQENFMEEVFSNEPDRPLTIKLEGFGDVEIEHLRQYHHATQQAFDMKMRMAAYWKIVLRRLVDSMALHLLFSVNNLVNKEMEMEIVNDLYWVLMVLGLNRCWRNRQRLLERGKGSTRVYCC